MVVLRAEREGGWLILGYDTPPTRYCSAHAAELEMSKQWLLEKVSVSECVCVGGGGADHRRYENTGMDKKKTDTALLTFTSFNWTAVETL